MKKPRLHKSVFAAEDARITGDVEIGADSSVWYHAVIRGDSNSVVIGKGTNIQDGAILHVDADSPLEIGNGVVVARERSLHDRPQHHFRSQAENPDPPQRPLRPE